MTTTNTIIITIVSSDEVDTDEYSQVNSKAAIILRAEGSVGEHLTKVLYDRMVHSLVVATEIVKN